MNIKEMLSNPLKEYRPDEEIKESIKNVLANGNQYTDEIVAILNDEMENVHQLVMERRIYPDIFNKLMNMRYIKLVTRLLWDKGYKLKPIDENTIEISKI